MLMHLPFLDDTVHSIDICSLPHMQGNVRSDKGFRMMNVMFCEIHGMERAVYANKQRTS